MINLIINGSNGKMGNVVARLALESGEFNIVAGIDINTKSNGDFTVYSSPKRVEDTADVIIDFSHPSSLSDILNFAVNRKIPLVIATTGLSSVQRDELIKASEKIPLFFSANMSIGVNLIIELVKKAANVLNNDFDIEIIEKHHNQKIDAPSGTALMIADAVSSVLPKQSNYIYDRHSQRKKRDKNEIGIHAVRGGTIVGEHSVIFAGNDEIIEIKHSAMSKEIFAVGALKAAKYLLSKNNGLYNMTNLVSEDY